MASQRNVDSERADNGQAQARSREVSGPSMAPSIECG